MMLIDAIRAPAPPPPPPPPWPGHTPSQARVLDHARAWWARGASRPLLITGPAGTGKTTLCQAIAKQLGEPFGLLAPTHAARKVLSRKAVGAASCTTIHAATMEPRITGRDAAAYEAARERLADARITAAGARGIYAQMRGMDARLSWTARDSFDDDSPRLLFVDEASMIGGNTGSALTECAAASGTALIVLGDLHQLPPVPQRDEPPGSYFFAPGVCEAAPELTDIVRQGAQSPILALAQHIRQHPDYWPQPGGYGQPTTDGIDQIICGRNATRWGIEDRMRLPGPPRPGEPMIALSTSHDQSVFNSDRFRVVACEPEHRGRALLIHAWFEGEDAPRWIRAEIEDRAPNPPYPGRGAPVRVGFAYAITCHRAQGSEWPAVQVINESFIARGDAGRWLYTAVSRARNYLVMA